MGFSIGCVVYRFFYDFIKGFGVERMSEEKKNPEEGKSYFIAFLRRKLELPISWTWNGITAEEKRACEAALIDLVEIR